MSDERRTVLLVEDDPDLRMLCRVNLELDGYRVLEAGSVADANERVSEGPVDVVLLDVRIGDAGGRSGLALLDLLPDGDERPAVALLTGSIDLKRFKRPAGVDAVISKPFAIDELASVVADLADR